MAELLNKILNNDYDYSKKIYLLGTAVSGPTNYPINIKSVKQLYATFGNMGTLIDAFVAIYDSKLDCEVYCVKVTGSHSEVYLDINTEHGEIISDGLRIYSKNADESCNDIKITISTNSFNIHLPDSLGGVVMEYGYDDYVTLHELCDAINNDTKNLRNYVYCEANCDSFVRSKGSLNGVNPDVVNLKGGNTGLYYNKNMMYVALDTTYSLLEGIETDIVVPLGVYYDDTFTSNEKDLEEFYDLDREYLTLKDDYGKFCSYHNQLLRFCVHQMSHGIITYGVIGCSDILETYNGFCDENNYVEKLQYFKRINDTDELKEYSHLITSTVGSLYCYYGTRKINSSIVYAAIASNISVAKNTTNVSIPKNFLLCNFFSNKFLHDLHNLGFTAFRYSEYSNSVCVSSGITMSNDGDMKYFVNVRMIQCTMSYVRRLFSEYIGQDMYKIVSSGILQDNLKSLLESLCNKKILKSYKVEEYRDFKNGKIIFKFKFKTVYMIEEYLLYTGIAYGR